MNDKYTIKLLIYPCRKKISKIFFLFNQQFQGADGQEGVQVAVSMGTPEGVHVATVTTENGEIVHIHQGEAAANQAATNQSITVPSATTTSPVVAVTDTPSVVIEQAE